MSSKICTNCVMEKMIEDYPFVNKSIGIRGKICRYCIKQRHIKRLEQMPETFNCRECLESISKYNFPLGSKVCCRCTNLKSRVRRSQRKYVVDIEHQVCKLCKFDKPISDFALSLESKHCVRKICKSCVRLSSGSYNIMNSSTEAVLSV